MCFNCGCQMPDNDMGNSDNITSEDFEKAAKASGQSKEEAMRNTRDLINKLLKDD